MANHTITHQFSTTSPACAESMQALLCSPTCWELVRMFSKLQSRKRRRVIVQMTRYLLDSEKFTRGQQPLDSSPKASVGDVPTQTSAI